MSTEYTGADSYPTTITLPSDGNNRKAESHNEGLRDLADRTMRLRNCAIRTGLRNWQKSSTAMPGSADIRGGAYNSTKDIWLSAPGTSATGKIHYSADDGRSWGEAPGMDTLVVLDIAYPTYTNTAVAVGVGTTIRYKSGDLTLSGTWSSATAPGTPDSLLSVAYTPAMGGAYITVGNKTGPLAPYIATGTTSGATWTERTAPASFAGKGMGSLAAGGPYNVCAAQSAHTKIAYSSDAGATWSDSTSSLVSGIYQVVAGGPIPTSTFYAIRMDSITQNYVYKSTDGGNNWTQVYASTLGLGIGGFYPGGSAYHGVALMGSALVVIGPHPTVSGVLAVSFSLTGGTTWERNTIVAADQIGMISDKVGRVIVGDSDYAYTSMRVSVI